MGEEPPSSLVWMFPLLPSDRVAPQTRIPEGRDPLLWSEVRSFHQLFLNRVWGREGTASHRASVHTAEWGVAVLAELDPSSSCGPVVRRVWVARSTGRPLLPPETVVLGGQPTC